MLADQLPRWRNAALKQKGVYRILNMWNYDLTRKCLIAEAWCPVSSYEDAQSAVRRGAISYVDLLRALPFEAGVLVEAWSGLGQQRRM